SWFVALIGHHASLPLVLVILYQDYRFALADLFLKRAISVLALVAVTLALYALLSAPISQTAMARPLVEIPGILLAAWIATALLYPLLRDAVDRFVDRIVLGRADYREVRATIARILVTAEAPAQALDLTCALLSEALPANRPAW